MKGVGNARVLRGDGEGGGTRAQGSESVRKGVYRPLGGGAFFLCDVQHALQDPGGKTQVRHYEGTQAVS